MRALPLTLAPGVDLRGSLERLAVEQQSSGFVLGVVGNLSRAAFQCPGRPEPTVLTGDLEIITLNGTVSPQGVHLHLSLSDGACQVWGGHLEHGTQVLKGADLLVGFLHPSPSGEASPSSQPTAAVPMPIPTQPRVDIAVLPGCPYSARALRMLRTLGIPHRIETVENEVQHQALARRSGLGTLPQVFIDGQCIGGYDALAGLHADGALEPLRTGW